MRALADGSLRRRVEPFGRRWQIHIRRQNVCGDIDRGQRHGRGRSIRIPRQSLRFSPSASAPRPAAEESSGDKRQSGWGSGVSLKLGQRLTALATSVVLRRALVSVAAIALFRLGFYVPLPSVKLANLPSSLHGSGEQFIFGAGNPVPANIFMLGVGPVIAASILTSLWAVLPFTREIGRKEGREGEANMRLMTRILATCFAMLMGAQTAVRLLPYGSGGAFFLLDITLTLTAGSMLLAHLAEEVSAHGLGEGISLMVATSILQRQAQAVIQIHELLRKGAISAGQMVFGTASLLVLVYAAITLAFTEKRYQIVSYKFKPVERRRKKDEEDRSGSLPVRVSPSGVSVLLTVSLYLSYLPVLLAFWNRDLRLQISAWMMSSTVLPFAVSILAFVLVSVDFTFGRLLGDLTSWMQRSSAGIKHSPPLLPGASTQRFLARQQSLAHFWGGLAVAVLGGLAFGLDQLSLRAIGVEMGAVSLLLLAGQMTVIHHQVEALSAIPRLGQRLISERALLQSFKTV